MQKKINSILKVASTMFASLALVGLMALAFTPQVVYADKCGGSGNRQIATDFEFGCRGSGNAIIDLLLGVVRSLSLGAGLIITASMVWAGLVYVASKDDPQATANAVKRIKANVIALAVFIFAYAILNYVVPGQVLK